MEPQNQGGFVKKGLQTNIDERIYSEDWGKKGFRKPVYYYQETALQKITYLARAQWKVL